MVSTLKPSKSNTTVAKKVTAIGIACVALVMVLLCIAVTSITNRSSHQQLRTTLTEVAVGLANTVDSVDAAIRSQATRASEGLSSVFEGRYELGANADLVLNGESLNGSFFAIDEFTKTTGNVATIFGRNGDDFIRITTSLRNAQGERVLNTPLDRTHTAYGQIMQGKEFVGPASLFGKSYMTRYIPIKGGKGEVIGIQFVGVDLTAFEKSLQEQIASTKLFTNGGVMLINPTGGANEAVFVAHPTQAGNKIAQYNPRLGTVLEQLATEKYAPASGALLPHQGPSPWAVAAKTASGWLAVVEVSNDEAMAQHNAALLWLWGVMALALVVLAMSQYVSLNVIVSKPLTELTEAVSLLTHGDLTRPFHSKKRDDVGQLIRAVDGLRTRYIDILNQVHTAAHNIASASSQVAQGNADLSERTESTAANLARAAQNIEEVTRSVMHTADSAAQAQTLSGGALNVAEKGREVALNVNTTMADIKGSSLRIRDIISVIDGIAFQTNILALNAAVEAARAGEQGRGFAVVAGEVRTLAGRSAEAAKEIKTLIEASVANVETGSSLVEAAGANMQEIVLSVQQVGDLIEEMAAAAREQVTQANQVNKEVSQLDQLTQQNAALVEESAAASHSMREQASRMEATVAVFKLPSAL